MDKISAIQKRNNLNFVCRSGEPGPGGAYHEYKVFSSSMDKILDIQFQKGPRGVEGSVPGVLDVDLLEIVRDRLSSFVSGDMPTRETAIALMNVEQALLWLNKRTEDRAERNVLGTYEK